MFLIKSLWLILAVSALALAVEAAPPAGDLVEMEIPLNSESGIASGATRMGGQFFLKGLESVGLFVGNPNMHFRADRVVMTFDARPLLRRAMKIKSAKLVFHADSIFGPDDQREIALVVFDRQLNELTEESLSSSEVKPVATVTVSSAEQNQGGQAAGMAKEFEVTNQLLEKIQAGMTSISFRLQDVKAEKEGNPNLQPTGITLDKRPGFLPKIMVRIER
jgi:hypothetical protein